MIINEQTLSLTFKGFQTIYGEHLLQGETHWDKIAMTIPSTGRSETYAWLGDFPQLREWIGPRHVNSLSAHGFTIENRKFESTIALKRDDLADDRLGVFRPIIAEMGVQARNHPEHLIFELLAKGFETECFDGQPFFDADHPVKDADGTVQSVSNIQAGSSTPWFLLDTSRALRPIIWQEREGYEFQSMDRPENPHVFKNDEYLYGVRARVNAGFGLWQLAFGSKAALNRTNYAAARAAMMGYRADGGRILGVKPTLLVVPPALKDAALQLLNAENDAAGASNVWRNTAELVVTPFLSGAA